MTQEHKIDWLTIVLQGVAQIIVVGTFFLSYIVVTARWQGGVDAQLKALTEANVNQAITNERLRLAIEKIGDSMSTIANNQAGIIKLLDYHMQQDAATFKKLDSKR
jgi:hypothetical protein